MQGHSAANLLPLLVANRVGLESVKACKENGNQKSSLLFYGSSFITDSTGAIIEEANREEEKILLATIDKKTNEEERLSWGIFRDRRPHCYKEISRN